MRLSYPRQYAGIVQRSIVTCMVWLPKGTHNIALEAQACRRNLSIACLLAAHSQTVAYHVADMRRTGYLQAFQEFCSWLVETERVQRNPILGVKAVNSDVAIRHKRRALTPDEFSKLVKAAEESKEEIQCFDGKTRAVIYWTTYATGLRRNEIGSLTPESFNLGEQPSTVTVEAAFSKHRKKDVLPLHPDYAKMMKAWLTGAKPNEPIFPKLGKRRTYLMVQKDLKAAGIPYKTQEGIADFHAAGRHTHITELLRNGASLPEARALARHSDVRTTMRYTHVGLADQAKAVGRLPWIPIGSGPRVSTRPQMTSRVTDSGSENPGAQEVSASENGTCVADRRQLSSSGNSDDEGIARVRFPPPPLCNSLSDNELSEEPTGLAASGQRSPDAAGQPVAANVTDSPTLCRLIQYWPAP